MFLNFTLIFFHENAFHKIRILKISVTSWLRFCKLLVNLFLAFGKFFFNFLLQVIRIIN